MISSNKVELFDSDIEIIVLSYFIKHPELYDEYFEKIFEEVFSNSINKKIFKVIKEFITQDRDISFDLIKNYVPEIQEKETKQFIESIDKLIYSPNLLISYIDEIYELYLRRELNKVNQEKISEISSFNTDKSIWDILLDLETKIYNLSNAGIVKKNIKNLSTVLSETQKIIDSAYKKDGEVTGITTGFQDLDNKLSGLQNSDLLILAGRPSMGKTALATNIAYNAALYFKKVNSQNSVLFFSLEIMSVEPVWSKIIHGTEHDWASRIV